VKTNKKPCPNFELRLLLCDKNILILIERNLLLIIGEVKELLFIMMSKNMMFNLNH